MDAEQHNVIQEKAVDEKAMAPGTDQGQNLHHHGSRRSRFKRGNRGGRGGRGQRGPRPEQSMPAETGQRKSEGSIQKAIEETEQIRNELRKALDDIHEVLRTLEQVEREKTASEEEIELLRESLRLLHRDQGHPRQPRNPPPRPSPVVEQADAEEDPDQGS